jgi:hypothetical protein
MKMHLLLALAGFAIGFVVPALAQEQNTVDPEVRQQRVAVGRRCFLLRRSLLVGRAQAPFAPHPGELERGRPVGRLFPEAVANPISRIQRTGLILLWRKSEPPLIWRTRKLKVK